MVRTILITGATGRQGGATIRALQDTDFEILAITRNPDSPGAQRLARQNRSIKLVQGDVNDVPAIFQRAKAVAGQPVWGVLSVQGDVYGQAEKEERQGRAMVDAAIASSVQIFVYNSVDRGGAKSATNPTIVPHWATKHRIEKYLEEKAVGTDMRWSVIRPVTFMEELNDSFNGKVLATLWKSINPKKALQFVAIKDVGWFSAQPFKQPDEWAGKYLSVAGDELTFDELDSVFRKTFGRDVPTTFSMVGWAINKSVKHVRLMLKVMLGEGYGADLTEIKRMHPDLTDFASWYKSESAFRS
ncbi:NAD(P)-binding protein [Lophiostoma macrostomum CBS 122681]|uniref:NAD(P)-binding protein n=1 Tax=Lophiostoma macrostomum CBS 122681 TaxID=1314788 RepID=A0A6A6SZN5_9PLEO|nr:NAD(P)-binding protein [Lophiostoma macrostomum CBS 122681]